MTRKYTPIIDDFTGQELDKEETRYTLEIIRQTEKRGELIKSNPLD